MRRHHATAFILLLISACVSPRRAYQTTPGGGPGGTLTNPGPGSEQSQGTPIEVLNRLDPHLASIGLTRIGPAVRNSNMPTNGMMAYAVEAQPGSCYLPVALAGAGADLNMVVLDTWGRTVSYNVNPDSHPWVWFCPSTAGRHVVRLQMARGVGEYYYALYQGAPTVNANLATWFGEGAGAGGGGGTEAVARVALDAGTQSRFVTLDQRFTGQGYQRAGEPQGLRLASREDRNFPLNLQTGYCYAFATLGGPGTSDTDVFVVDGSGSELERDVRTDIDGVLEFCPPGPGSYTLRARLYEGNGPVFVASWTRVAVPQAGTPPPPPPQTEVISTAASTAGAGLDENYRLIDADMQARGYRSHGQPSRGELTERQTRSFDISLEGGKCYAILSVGDNGVRDLDLILRDENGTEIDRDIEADARPIVRVCAERTGTYKIDVSVASGNGGFIYAPYQWPRGTRGPFGLAGLIYVRLAEVTSLLSVEGYEPSADFTPEKSRLRREGQSARHNLRLPAGSCYTVLVVGGEGLADLDVKLSNGRTELAADGTRNAFPSVRYCAQQTESVSLEVTARSGAGEYFYQVFQRTGG